MSAKYARPKSTYTLEEFVEVVEQIKNKRDSEFAECNHKWSSQIIVSAANGILPGDEQTRNIVKKACINIAAWLFWLPEFNGADVDIIKLVRHINANEDFSESAFGKIWWRAFTWAHGNELMTMKELAAIAGITLPYISQKTTLAFFLNPDAKRRQSYRWILRSQAESIWPQIKDAALLQKL